MCIYTISLRFNQVQLFKNVANSTSPSPNGYLDNWSIRMQQTRQQYKGKATQRNKHFDKNSYKKDITDTLEGWLLWLH